MPRIRVNGIDLHYRLEGRGPWVTLSHALTTDLSLWDDLAAVLAESCTVLRYDTRGHGGSDAPAGPYDFAMLTGDVLGLLDALGVERTHFVGLSLGGMIAQHLALRAPQRIGRLVIASSTSRMPPATDAVWQERIAQAQAQGTASLAAATLQRWFTRPFRAAHPALMQRISALIAATPVAGYVGCAEAIRRLDITARLAAVKAPTLVVVGADDPGTPPAVGEAIAHAIPGAQLDVIPSASHLCCLEQPDAFNRRVAAFLAD
ncbi:MAG: 3-oxoadipate enol-lactonase [Rhodocyclaceae bacterium]|nr:3-oxoadipate enol-lactonase [Rhodocyclaceae bacterium]